MIFALLCSLVVFYMANRLIDLFLSFEDLDLVLVDRLIQTQDYFFTGLIERPFFISLETPALMTGVVMFILIWLIWLYKDMARKNYKRGAEHGSARWAKPEEIKKLVDKNDDENMIFTATEKVSIHADKTMLNNNVMLFGDSGSRKTSGYVKPNLMQMNMNYIITDPKGTVLTSVGNMLRAGGYRIKVFNTVDFLKSMRYNPFAYIHDEKDILKFINALIMNTKGKDAKEDFWVSAEKLLYMALVGYMFHELKPQERNFDSLLDLLSEVKISEGDDEFESKIDVLFRKLEREKGSKHFAVRQYKEFKDKAPAETAKSIMVSCSVRLAPFAINAVREITEYDEMNFESFATEKTALFIVIDDKDSTFNFLVAIMYTQLFNKLCDLADNKYNGTLPIHVHAFLDELANIGKIPELEKLIATIRSRGISLSAIFQDFPQIKANYKDHAGTIIANCHKLLFLGGTEEETTKKISARAGKTTIDHRTNNETRGRNASTSINNQIIARDLITADEVGLLKMDECLLFVRGLHPFKSKKYNLNKHPRYKELADDEPEHLFDVGNYIEENAVAWVKEAVKKDEVQEVEVQKDDFLKALSELETAGLDEESLAELRELKVSLQRSKLVLGKGGGKGEFLVFKW